MVVGGAGVGFGTGVGVGAGRPVTVIAVVVMVVGGVGLAMSMGGRIGAFGCAEAIATWIDFPTAFGDSPATEREPNESAMASEARSTQKETAPFSEGITRLLLRRRRRSQVHNDSFGAGKDRWSKNDRWLT
jgi:hypothetical protein